MRVVTCIDDLRDLAKKRVARAIFDYVDRGSYSEWTLRRSEEHTSKLQSQSNLVCRLLLEKKNRRIGKRLAVGAHQLGQQVGGVWPQDLLVVVGLVQARDLARVGHLREVLLLETDRKRLDRLRADLAHDRHHGG